MLLSQRVCDRYKPLAACLHSTVGDLPVAIEPLDSSLHDVVHVAPMPASPDPRLVAAGQAHLDHVRERRRVHDGPTLVLDRISNGQVTVRPAGYFDMLATCDSLLAEASGSGPWPMRSLADAAAGGDPLHVGHGRAAAVGVSLVTTTVRHGWRRAIIGRRRADLATDPGLWHIVPSGMLEPSTSTPLLATVRAELEEELGITLSNAELSERLVVLGVAYDLLRLRPEICLQLDLRSSECPTVTPDEFDACSDVDLRSRPHANEVALEEMTPAGAGAVVLAVSQIKRKSDRPGEPL